MDGAALEFRPGGSLLTDPLSQLAPRPRALADTGLSQDFVAELLLKHLYSAGVLELRQLVERVALAGTILEQALGFLRTEACLEVRGGNGSGVGLRYALTERGRSAALDALARSGYVGAAPVPLEDYARVVRAQSVHRLTVTRDLMRTAFADTVIREALLDQLGPALHSGRAMFVYGPAGTGKTFVGQRLTRLLGDEVLIPHALAVGDTAIPLFDSVVHRALESAGDGPGLMLAQGHDPRFVRCRRPVIITGGELTLDMLELRYDPASKQYLPPLQLKAANGMFMIDDLGRQRAPTADLLNRWIVPMEERRDFLSLGSGRHFPVPFDMVLVFSTNLDPLALADDAFLRRLGYKIRFDYLDPAEYEAVWRQTCEARGVPFDLAVFRHLLVELHAERHEPLRPCYPRDLLDLALDRCRYEGEPNAVTVERIRWAWDNYFVRLREWGMGDGE